VVDDVAGVVAGDVGRDLRPAGLGIDFHLGDVAAVRKGGAEFVGIGDVELAGAPLREALDRNRAVGALDAVAPGGELDVGLGRLELFGRHGEAFLHHLARGEHQHAPHGKERARAAGRVAGEIELRTRGAQAHRGFGIL
jgi:hypothetical protein